MGRTREQMLEIAHRHAAAEANGDLVTTMDTLDPNPVYEFQPAGLLLKGLPAVRTYYEHFFKTFQPQIAGYDLRGEWVNDEGLGQEYFIHLRTPEGGTETHAVIGILLFGKSGLSGERLYASDRMLRIMFGPAWDLAERIAR
jgi:hypothetical protein